MKYRVKILKQPKYQNGGRTLGDFSNLTEDQLENGLVYGYNDEPEEVLSVNDSMSNNRPSMTRMENIPYVMKQPDKEPMVAVPISVLQSLQQPKSKSTNKSIVDALTDLNFPSSFSFRKKLAAENNIKNYTGTANQNLKLLSILNNQVAMSFDDEPVSNAVATTKKNTKTINKKQTSINSNVKNIIPFISNSGNYQVTATDVNKRPFQSEINMGSLGNVKLNGKTVGRKIDPRIYEKSMVNAAAIAASAFLPSLIPTVEYLPLLRGLPKGPQGKIPGPRNMPTAPPKGWTSGSGMQSPGFPFYQDGGGMEQEDDGQSQVLQIIQAFAEANGVDAQQIVQQLQQMGEEEQKQTIMQMYQELQGVESQDQNSNMGYDMQTAAYGGQMGYGLDLGSRRLWMNQDTDEELDVNNTLSAVPREHANIEAEGGETAVVPKEDGTKSHYNIKGKRHTEGGVPLNVPEGTFIFSDTKKMKMGGSVLSVFGKSEKSSKKFTPAQLAKQYDLNKYKAILEDPRADSIKKRTAELMIQNYNKKLAQLALVQEGKKGYPQGIPNIAQEYYAKMMQASDVESQEQIEENPREEMKNPVEAMYGGSMMYGGGMKYGGMNLKRYIGDEEGSEVESDNITNGINLSSRINSKKNPYELTIPQSDVPDFTKSFDYQTALEQNQQGINRLQNASLFSDEEKQKSKFIDKDGNLIGSNVLLHNYLKNNPYTFNFDNESKIKNNDITTYNRSPIKYGWTNPDNANLLNSLKNLAGVKKFTNFEPTIKLARNSTRYLSPIAALASNAGMYNAARQAAAMLAGPQSRYSLNSGEFAKNAANIQAEYDNKNVQLGNIAAAQDSDITNKQMMYDAQRAKRLYDAGVINEQQYQNAMRQARAGVLQAYTQGMRNAADLYNMSMTESPYYGVRPGTGTIYFHSPKSMQGFFNSQSDTGKMSAKDIAQAAKDANMSVSEYLDYMKMQQGMINDQTKGRKSRNQI
jgi:hypothetical protein